MRDGDCLALRRGLSAQAAESGFNAQQTMLQLGQALEHRLLPRLGRAHSPLLQPMPYQGRPVQLKAPNVKNAGSGETDERAIRLPGDVPRKVVPVRVEDSLVGVWLSVVALELVAGVAAVDQVLPRVAAAIRKRLEMVDSQLSAGVTLVHAALGRITHRGTTLKDAFSLLLDCFSFGDRVGKRLLQPLQEVRFALDERLQIRVLTLYPDAFLAKTPGRRREIRRFGRFQLCGQPLQFGLFGASQRALLLQSTQGLKPLSRWPIPHGRLSRGSLRNASPAALAPRSHQDYYP